MKNYSLCLNQAHRSEGEQRALITFNPVVLLLLCHHHHTRLTECEEEDDDLFTVNKVGKKDA